MCIFNGRSLTTHFSVGPAEGTNTPFCTHTGFAPLPGAPRRRWGRRDEMSGKCILKADIQTSWRIYMAKMSMFNFQEAVQQRSGHMLVCGLCRFRSQLIKMAGRRRLLWSRSTSSLAVMLPSSLSTDHVHIYQAAPEATFAFPAWPAAHV